MTIGVIMVFLTGLMPTACPILNVVKTVIMVTLHIEAKMDPPALLKQRLTTPFFRHLFKLQMNMA